MTTLGVILVTLGAALMVAEAHVPSHGVLATGAAAALTAGVVLALSGAGAGGAAVVVPATGHDARGNGAGVVPVD